MDRMDGVLRNEITSVNFVVLDIRYKAVWNVILEIDMKQMDGINVRCFGTSRCKSEALAINKHLILSYVTDGDDVVVPLADRRKRLLVRLPVITAADSAKSPERVMEKSPVTARSPEFESVELKEPMPKRLQPTPEFWRTTPEVSVAAQLPPEPEPQANQPIPSSNKDVIFHFFLADEHHGAIPQPFQNCQTMSSFFDEALAAWGTLSEEQHQLRMVAVKVIIEGVSRPIVVLWRNKEGFERMMETVLKQAAAQQTELNVEVRCFKKG